MLNPENENRIRKILIYSKLHVPYYSSVLPSIDILSNEYIFDLLDSIPLLSRNILQDQKALFHSSIGDKSTWIKIRTSGTSGEPLEIVLDVESLTTETILFSEHVDSLLCSQKWRKGEVFHLTLHANAGSRSMPSLWDNEGCSIKWNLINIWQLENDDFFRYLSRINGQIITLMPSVAELLAQRLLASNREGDITPSLIILSGEMVMDQTRNILEKAFSCPVTSLYTISECGILAIAAQENKDYCIAESSVFIEIIDRRGRRLDSNQEGEIIITPLNNYAMPLIRYKTGDYGYWSSIDKIRLVLTDARKPLKILTRDGAFVNTIRFAKIFASLDIDRYALIQENADEIEFVYYKKTGPMIRSCEIYVQTVLQSALGLAMNVNIIRVKKLDQFDDIVQNNIKPVNIENNEPLNYNIDGIADWLTSSLKKITGIKAAVLTGSALDSSAISRFSDIDLIIFVENRRMEREWIELASAFNMKIPQLSITIDNYHNFEKRAPLLSCRLKEEIRVIYGNFNADSIKNPSSEDIINQCRFWAQDAYAILLNRLISLKSKNIDIIKEAWICTKFVADALRYRYLLKGNYKTSQKDILELLKSDKDIPVSYKTVFINIFDLAKEYIPPGLEKYIAAEQYLYSTLTFLEDYFLISKQ